VRAAVCRAHGQPLSVEEIAVADPAAAEVRVNISVCAICHSDIHFAAGAWGGDVPVIFGHEAAGVVESVGVGVTSVAPGDRVIVGLLRTCGACFYCVRGEDNLCVGVFDQPSPFTGTDGRPIARGLKTGAFAEQTVVHESQVVQVPDDVPLAPAALLACGVLTGFGAVSNTAAMPSGSTAAVIGVGGVGLGAVQAAVQAGSTRIVAIDVVDEKLEIAEQFGATHSINGSVADPAGLLGDLTDGVGPDYVFVTVGAKPAIDQALSMVRPGGTVVLVGMPPLGVMTEFETVMFSDRSQRIIGSKMGSARMSVDVPRLIELYRAGSLHLDEMISNRYGIEQINEAVAEVERGSVIRNVISFER